MQSSTLRRVILGAVMLAAAQRAVAVDVDYCGSVGTCASGADCRTQVMGHVCGDNKACIYDNAKCEEDTIRCFCTRGGVLFEGFSEPLIIEDNNPADLTVSLDVPSPAGNIVDMVIQLTIEHAAIGDLNITLTHGTTTVTLIDRPGRSDSGPGCDADLSCERSIYLSDSGSIPIECAPGACGACFANGQVPSGVFAPNQPLAAFANQNAAGTWALSIADNAQGNVGALCRWGISMRFEEPVATTPAVWGLVKRLYRD